MVSGYWILDGWGTENRIAMESVWGCGFRVSGMPPLWSPFENQLCNRFTANKRKQSDQETYMEVGRIARTTCRYFIKGIMKRKNIKK